MDRKKYKNLVKWKGNSSKPLVLLGARQVGKTFLIKQFAQDHYQKFHYFNFEQSSLLNQFFDGELSPKRIIQNLEIHQEEKIKENDLIIFDEIQQCPNALTSLKYFCEQSSYNIIAAGSLLGLKLSSASFPVGKVDLDYLYPLSFEEFLKANNSFLFSTYEDIELKDIPISLHQKLKSEYLLYLFTGGMPEIVAHLVNAKEKNQVDLYIEIRNKQKAIIEGYLADFAKHSGKVNSMHIDRVWQESAIQLGKTQMQSSKRFQFKNVISGKKQYSQFQSIFDWLDKAALINRCFLVKTPSSPLEAYVKESFFKSYIFDVGLLGAMIDISMSEILEQKLETYKGFIAENFIANHLRALGQKNLYYWEGLQSEIEFILKLSDSIVPIEVKSGSRTKAKSLMSYNKKYSPKEMIIFGMMPFKENNGLNKVPLWCIEKWYRKYRC